MARGFLPLSGTEAKYVLPKKGDIIETHNGERFVFIDKRIVRWTGQCVKTGKRFNIPFYLDRFKTKPFSVKVVGFDASFKEKTVKDIKIKFGDLFALTNRKETFMFIGDINKKGKKMIQAKDVATGNTWSIGLECTLNKINFTKLKNEAKA